MALTTVRSATESCLQTLDQYLERERQLERPLLELYRTGRAMANHKFNFSRWAEAMNVFSKPGWSLDYRLREDPDAKEDIVDMIQALRSEVAAALAILNVTGPAAPGLLSQSIRGAAKYIDILLGMSKGLAMGFGVGPLPDEVAGIRICDRDDNDIEETVRELLGAYVRTSFPEAPSSIQDRLAETMMMRRKMILRYRLKFGKDALTWMRFASTRSVVPKSPAPIDSTDIYDDLSAVIPPCPIEPIILKHYELKKSRQKSKELVEPSKYLSQDSLNSIRSSMSDQDWNEAVEAVGEVTCPFCVDTMPARDAVDLEKWNDHVTHDVDPFVCLVENCDMPEAIYRNRDRWLLHMREHDECALRWTCSKKSHKSYSAFSKTEFVEHLQTVHKAKKSVAELNTQADKRVRRAHQDHMFRTCPLCKEQISNGYVMRKHMTLHLQRLGLVSLPDYGETGMEVGVAGSSDPDIYLGESSDDGQDIVEVGSAAAIDRPSSREAQSPAQRPVTPATKEQRKTNKGKRGLDEMLQNGKQPSPFDDSKSRKRTADTNGQGALPTWEQLAQKDDGLLNVPSPKRRRSPRGKIST